MDSRDAISDRFIRVSCRGCGRFGNFPLVRDTLHDRGAWRYDRSGGDPVYPHS